MGFPNHATIEVPGNYPELSAVAASALSDPDGAQHELVGGLLGQKARAGHLCVNAWILDPDMRAVVLVEHPRFSWTNPGGHLIAGETPSAGAAREVLEETGLVGRLAIEVPVAIVATLIPAVSRPTGDLPAHMHYTLTYAYLAERDATLGGEAGQRVQWFNLDEPLPEGFFGDNWHVHGHVERLRLI